MWWMFLAMQNSYSVEAGLYHCFPLHAAHLMKADDGSVSEITIGTEGVISIIVIDSERIDISDNRSGEPRLIDIISNENDGPVQGRSGFRQFFMNDILHYFYGSTDSNNTVAYAEDGMCSRLSQ